MSSLNIDLSESRNPYSVEDGHRQSHQVPVLKELSISGKLETHVENDIRKPIFSDMNLETGIARTSDSPVDHSMEKNLGGQIIDIEHGPSGSSMNLPDHGSSNELVASSNEGNTTRVAESNYSTHGPDKQGENVGDSHEPAVPSVQTNSHTNNSTEFGGDTGIRLEVGIPACSDVNMFKSPITNNLNRGEFSFDTQKILAELHDHYMLCDEDFAPPISLVIHGYYCNQQKLPSKQQRRAKRPRGESREMKALSCGKSLREVGTSFESGVRRSKRIKTRPLEYWKGESFLYGRVNEGLQLIGLKYISPAKGDAKLKSEIQQPHFWQRRKAAGLIRPFIAMAQARVNPYQHGHEDAKRLSYQLIICDPEQGFWYEVPPIPGFSEGLPMFCQVVGVGINLLVMGGFDPVIWKTLNSVFIYDFVAATWRGGADMPGGQRSFFGCASDCNRTVLIAGGHDGNKNALTSCMMYDVVKDEWTILLDTSIQRDECKCVFHHGKFHVIGGYCTERQGGFERSAEVFDVNTCQWDQLDDFLPEATCPRNSVNNCDQKIYLYVEGDVLELENTTWKEIFVGLAADVYDDVSLTAWQNRIFVCGLARANGLLNAYVIDGLNGGLTRIEIPSEHSGHVQSGCYLEI
ncbi:hypothetical protein ACH5RR_024534 [Cinchona calisaya]|uniref:Uncharacterized protein n=1 Tax=Cinchona calisaya TaxID=153742 RepID=A0ABD2Z139_9GENT